MSMAHPTHGHALARQARRDRGVREGQETHHETEQSATETHEHQRGLWVVGIYKLLKAVFFTALGAGALRLIHANVGDLTMRFVDWVHLDSEGRVASFLMDRADLIGHHQLRQSALFSFLYAGVCVVEGTGLLLEKRWAEYLTTILTAMALPWEAYELVERFEPYKVVLTVLNIAVLLYLLWVLKKKGMFGSEPDGGL